MAQLPSGFPTRWEANHEAERDRSRLGRDDWLQARTKPRGKPLSAQIPQAFVFAKQRLVAVRWFFVKPRRAWRAKR